MSNPLLSVYYNEISCNEFKNKCDINQELVILSKQTLTQAQKDVLKKGLSFIPKPKKLNIHQLLSAIKAWVSVGCMAFTDNLNAVYFSISTSYELLLCINRKSPFLEIKLC